MWRPAGPQAGLESSKLQMVPFPLQHAGCYSNVVRSCWGRTACELAERNMLNNDMWNIPIRCFSPSKPSFIFLFNIKLNTSCCKNASNVQNGGFADFFYYYLTKFLGHFEYSRMDVFIGWLQFFSITTRRRRVPLSLGPANGIPLIPVRGCGTRGAVSHSDL